jgi:hypothetical protein
VLEQIESSSLAADAESLESEAASTPATSNEPARVLTFDAAEGRSGVVLDRDRRHARDWAGKAPSDGAEATPAAAHSTARSPAHSTTRSVAHSGTRSAADPAAPADAHSAIPAAPAFIKPSRRASAVWLYASLTALVLLAAQLTNHFRSDLASVEGIGPMLRNLYGSLGIDLIPRWDLAQYRIVDWVATAEPNAKGRGSLRITAQIQNDGRRAQPFPYVHLQLKDRWEKSVASRMFRPVEYLDASERSEQLMPAGATARAELEVVDPGPDAYGFELDVCIEQPDETVRCAADDVFR